MEIVMDAHIGLLVANLDASIALYTSALAPLGYLLCTSDGTPAGFGRITWQSRKFHGEGLSAGGGGSGAAGPRPDYGLTCHAAFLNDPDGSNFEAVCI
jgi:catechol 2,3-dioxygenase-like lactoylglutathione lyase family enzyme